MHPIPGRPEHDLGAMGSACVSSLRFHQHRYSDQSDRQTMSEVLRIWRFPDGKSGHGSQSLGLVRNLGARTTIRVTSVPVGSCRQALRTPSIRHGGKDISQAEPRDASYPPRYRRSRDRRDGATRISKKADSRTWPSVWPAIAQNERRIFV